MRSLVYKLLAVPAVLSAVDWLLPEVSFQTWQLSLLVGVVLALVLHAMDRALLPILRPFRMALVDGGATTLLLIMGANWMTRLQVHSGGALLAGFLVGLISYAIQVDDVVTSRLSR